MHALFNAYQRLLHTLRHLDGLPALGLRLYLAPIFLIAGFNKLAHFDDTVAWFGNADWGLGLPMPAVLVALAIVAEILGGFALLLGLATRLLAVPLMVTMLVAALSAHWDNGWFAIAPSNPDSSIAKVLAVVDFPGAKESLANSAEVGERLSAAKRLLREHGHYDWLTEKGGFVILNNGIEFAVTYFLMLLALFFSGGGRYVSLDHYLHRYMNARLAS
ncbi:MAG: DoxX family protein [Gammaproteobacteria bacterium]|nr:MAG: DoxX family protein [Gammaproteobacteria bacterium]